MKRRILLLCMALAFTSAVMAEFVDMETAVEAGRIELLIDSSAQGLAIAQRCIQCPVRVQVNPQTRFYLDDKLISAEQAKRLSGKPATLIHDLDGKTARRILW